MEEITSCGFQEEKEDTTSCGLLSKGKWEITSCDLGSKEKEKVLPKHQSTTSKKDARVRKETLALISMGCPMKKGDPRAFVDPCSINDMEFYKALVGLRASINLMPLSVFERLNLSYLSPTRLTLHLADGTIRYPKGLEEDVLVKVGEFIVPVDFIVCEMGRDEPFGSLILGRPFFATSRALIDVGTGEITLRFDGEKAKTEKVNILKEGKSASKDMVKVKTKTKPKWEIEKLVWKNTWTPKCFQPMVNDKD
ncbi:uncharacterized protein LOC116013204 [Ipomoea triloba]|uniref:uncharacterized protein LOC116013203 n=1 Tax=Ipomoea triloba TaxID=35885 RepID=UPI00125E4ABD|nr:uncharacterized protein LOC116013203 [Ipomoea triloba]XP_031108712.1 uncharacterized protein LOC116013204 [Ipomoea triloba]